MGERLRRTRLQQNLSIREMAKLADLSKTSIVQVEAGRTTRRSTYLKVAEVLGLHLEQLLLPCQPDALPFAVHRNSDDAWFDLANFDNGKLDERAKLDGEYRRKLLDQGVVPLNILGARLERGRIKPTVIELAAESETRSHAGEEYVFVLAGRAVIRIGGHVVELDQSESVTFWSAEPHSYAPQAGSPLPVRLLSVRVDG